MVNEPNYIYCNALIIVQNVQRKKYPKTFLLSEVWRCSTMFKGIALKLSLLVNRDLTMIKRINGDKKYWHRRDTDKYSMLTLKVFAACGEFFRASSICLFVGFRIPQTNTFARSCVTLLHQYLQKQQHFAF